MPRGIAVATRSAGGTLIVTWRLACAAAHALLAAVIVNVPADGHCAETVRVVPPETVAPPEAVQVQPLSAGVHCEAVASNVRGSCVEPDAGPAIAIDGVTPV